MAEFAAALLVAAAFVIGGRMLASAASERVEFIKEILLMLNIFETRLRYAGAPVSELLHLASEGGCSRLLFLEKCGILLAEGEIFKDAWEKCIREHTAFCRLLPEESEKLIGMGSDIGRTDVEGQLSCCGYYKEIFGACLLEKEEIFRRSAALYPKLGIMFGVSAALFLA
ncbi:MAG: stage III sporulation protein AB [Clostridia bacterium]|nr:stage III sporulation protein AB [Clostridia bacterium]